MPSKFGAKTQCGSKVTAISVKFKIYKLLHLNTHVVCHFYTQQLLPGNQLLSRYWGGDDVGVAGKQ